MRSSVEDPSNPWPRDMTIRIINDDEDCAYLLFVRHAWELDVFEVPSIERPIETGRSFRPSTLDERIAAVRWLGAWTGALRAVVKQPASFEAQLALYGGREADPSPLSSPYFSEGIDRGAFDSWRWEQVTADRALRIEDTPERMSLPALIFAWRAGLSTIIELPFAADFADRVSASHLVVSSRTRHDRGLFTAALDLRP